MASKVFSFDVEKRAKALKARVHAGYANYIRGGSLVDYTVSQIEINEK